MSARSAVYFVFDGVQLTQSFVVYRHMSPSVKACAAPWCVDPRGTAAGGMPQGTQSTTTLLSTAARRTK